MSTTSIDAPAGLRAAAGSEDRRPRGANRRLVLPYLFLGVLVVYFLIPIWWLFVASTKTAAGLFNGSNGALWFDQSFALIPNLKILFTYNDGIYLRWIGNSLFYAVAGWPTLVLAPERAVLAVRVLAGIPAALLLTAALLAARGRRGAVLGVLVGTPPMLLYLASVTNPNGLEPLGNNAFAETSNSGTPLVGTPNTGSLGVLQSSAVENSNVDMTAELVNMITAQRVYQANAQTIKTQDSVLQTLVNLR